MNGLLSGGMPAWGGLQSGASTPGGVLNDPRGILAQMGMNQWGNPIDSGWGASPMPIGQSPFAALQAQDFWGGQRLGLPPPGQIAWGGQGQGLPPAVPNSRYAGTSAMPGQIIRPPGMPWGQRPGPSPWQPGGIPLPGQQPARGGMVPMGLNQRF